MNKFAVVLGVAAVVTLAGCRDPEYDSGLNSGNDVKVADTTPPPPPPKAEVVTTSVIVATPPPPPVEKHCSCPPGTKHVSPCACGANDCACVVVAKPVVPAEPVYTTYIVQRGDYLAKISKKFNLTIGSIKRLNGLKSDTVRIGQKLKLPGKVDVGAQAVPAVTPVVAKPAKSVSAPKAFTGATKEYVVRNGDTLGAIALSNGISVSQLRQLNALKSDSLKIGQKLKVPAEKQVRAAKSAKPVAKTPEVKDAGVAKDAGVVKDAGSVKPVGAGEAEKPGAAPAPVPVSEGAVDEKAEPVPPVQPSDEAKVEGASAPKLNTYTVTEGDDITSVSIKWGVTAAEIRELNNLPEDAQLKPGQVLKLPAEAQL